MKSKIGVSVICILFILGLSAKNRPDLDKLKDKKYQTWSLGAPIFSNFA